jgi:signal transduction histidine kinase
VLSAIARTAARLCEASDVLIYLREGDHHRLVAKHGRLPQRHRVGQRHPVTRTTPLGLAVLGRLPVHVRDIQQARAQKRFSGFKSFRLRGRSVRTVLAMPLLREGTAVGGLVIRRTRVAPFTAKQIALLRTFADQAAIAIENARLSERLADRNRELSEALEQQTATGEILRVISSSPTDLAPVFDTIVRNAGRVCDADNVAVRLVEGADLVLAAHHGRAPSLAERVPLESSSSITEAVREKRPVHIEDITSLGNLPGWRQRAVEQGIRTVLTVPLLREGTAVGGIVIRRTEVRPFTPRQIALLQTFADQAVIAIENVRLFAELQARNQELTDALDRQTATGDILQVISRSQTDVRPVFETIADSALRLFRAWSVVVCRYDGEQLHLEAARGGRPDSEREIRGQFPLRANQDSAIGVAVVTRQVHHTPDAQGPDRDRRLVEVARARGFRSAVAAPMLRDGEPVGAMVVTRAEVRPFSPAEIDLLRTFTDQAVIAIENARLFGELQQRTGELARSVDELRALSEVGQAVSSTLDLDAVLQAIVTRAAQLAGTRGCSIWEYDEGREVFTLRATTIEDDEIERILRSAGIRKGEGAIGRAALTKAPVQIPDVGAAGAYEGRLRDALLRAGGGSVLTLPLLHEDRLLGGLTVSRRATGEFPAEVVALLTTFAAQSAIALQNARLFRELEAKSRELEIASRHKSQFLANMSHELRTPLNAILGYGEMMADGIYGELPSAAKEVLGRVDASGRHLLGLINDVLDLSKIEAGQLTLALAEYSMEEVARTIIVSVEALAAEKSLVLGLDVAPDLPTGHGDQRRLTQVLLNLVGNALKFTEEGGVGVHVTAADGMFAISVRDTGPGIAPADQERIFEEFQQADTSTTRPKGGTGLGLAIARRIVALHGGRLWVESVPGEGATFRLTVPVRVERQAVLRTGAPS